MQTIYTHLEVYNLKREGANNPYANVIYELALIGFDLFKLYITIDLSCPNGLSD